MTMTIGHNLGSMNALSALTQNGNALNSALQQLSTGKRINSAADDAAGLAISQKMQSQINGLNQASSNAQNGISLIQTAEGALNETQSILQRMRDLATQSANDTNTTTDRGAMQQEIGQLTQEIDRIANTTQFNTKNLLNGGAGIQTTVTGDTKNAITVIGGTANTQANSSVVLTAFTAATAKTTTSAALTGGNVDQLGAASNVTINGTTLSFAAGANGSDVASSINQANIGITASYSSTTHKLTVTTNAVGSGAQLNISGTGDLAGMTNASVTGGADAVATITGTPHYTASGNTITIDDAASTANGLSFSVNAPNFTAGSTVTVNANNSLTLQIGANQGQTMSVTIGNATSGSLGVSNIDVTTQSGAENAISTLDSAIQQVSGYRANLGAYQNRLQHTINNLGTSANNLTTAQSGITDVNMAEEMAQFTKDNVLQQAAVSMLAQANQQPQLVLKLLG